MARLVLWPWSMVPLVTPEILARLQLHTSRLRSSLAELQHLASEIDDPRLSTLAAGIARKATEYIGLVDAVVDTVVPDLGPEP